MSIQRITLNYLGIDKVRQAEFNRRPHYVVPMTMLKQGVVNGSKGPLYYPAEEIEKHPDSWNHMPIVLNHPQHNNLYVSARR